MRAARLHGVRDVRVDDIPRPEPRTGEVLVRVRAVAICPSDWRMYVDGHAGGVTPDGPIVQGHEFAGDVAELGPGVGAPMVETRVAVEPSWSCGECDMCLAGKGHICRRVRFPSFPPVDGALAEYIAVPARFVCPLPPDVTYAQGALAEPLGVALHAVRLASIAPGDSAVVLGAGVIGISVLCLLRSLGVAAIAVVEPADARREWPLRIGAGPVVSRIDDLLCEAHEATVVFECSGEREGLDDAVHLAAPGGRIVVVGIPRDERITFDMSIARRRELTVTFSRRSNETLVDAVELLGSRRVDLTQLPYRRYPLDQAGAAIEATGDHGRFLRSIVEP